MDQVSIFVSHSTKYADIANSLKRALMRVPTRPELLVNLSEDMPAGREWRQWIDDNVRTADVFVLLYPHPSMDMSWCNYELGRFYQRDDNVVCIRNSDIPNPPKVFEPYQSIQADEAGLMKFMKDLFVSGALTHDIVLNENVGRISTDEGAIAADIARELAEKFAEARVDEQLYERRLVLSVKYGATGKIDADNSLIEGNENGINLLGFRHMPGMRWSDVRNVLVTSADWPVELEQAMTAMASGQLPPPLSPFRSPSGIFIPVIVKADIVDRQLRQVFIIFVPADATRLGALIEGSSLPMGMPSNFKSLIYLLRLIFRVRWDILEPRLSEARYRAPSRERCAEIAGLIISEYDEISADLASLHLTGYDAFHEVFEPELWDDIDACTEQWRVLVTELRTKAPESAEELARLLTALRDNNGTWLNLGASQFTKAVSRYCN